MKQEFTKARGEELRIGQVYFNLMLTRCNKKFAESVRGTHIDPYYDSGKCNIFMLAAGRAGVFTSIDRRKSK